jgi:hypothetical protein
MITSDKAEVVLVRMRPTRKQGIPAGRIRRRTIWIRLSSIFFQLTQSSIMPDKRNIVDFEKVAEPLVHQRRERKVKKMRSIFKAVRESFSPKTKQQVHPDLKRKPKKKKKKR